MRHSRIEYKSQTLRHVLVISDSRLLDADPVKRHKFVARQLVIYKTETSSPVGQIQAK